jgi:hypothetical protein
LKRRCLKTCFFSRKISRLRFLPKRFPPSANFPIDAKGLMYFVGCW